MSEVERRRAEAIASLGLLEQAGDSALTALVRLGTYVTGAGAGAVHLFTEESQHRVAAVGAPLGEHPREDSMCRLVVDEEQRVVCADATRDLRFGYSSFVRGPEPVRFYLSVPLRVSGGEVIGTLCAWDTQARELDDEQLARFDDVADFKQVNDTYGHDVGDEVLVAIAQRLTGATRPQDTVARLGGDQFVVVAEVPDTHAALDVWERIEEAISGTIHVGETAEAVFMTVGATFAQPGDDPRTAIARADREMYSRKPSRVEDLADGDAAA